MMHFKKEHPRLANTFTVAAAIGVLAASCSSVFGAAALAVHYSSLVQQIAIVAGGSFTAGVIASVGTGLIDRFIP